MIEFLPSSDLEINQSLCAQAGIEFTPAIIVYLATERGKQIGFGIFAVEAGIVKVLHIPEDEYLADILTRSGLNYAELRGIELANFSQANHIDLLQKLNFVKQDINTDLPIAEALHSCKNCGKS